MKAKTSTIIGVLVTVLSLASVAPAQSAGPVQQEKSFEKEIRMKVKLNYLLYLPPGYGTEDKSWPLILFLHGAEGVVRP